MTDDRLPLAELMAKTGDGDFLRSVAESVLQIIMEADVDGLIGAGRHERSGERSTWRNGYRDRSLDTRLCAMAPDIVRGIAGNAAADAASRISADADIVEASKSLVRDMQAWNVGFNAVAKSSHDWLARIWDSAAASVAALGQDAAGGAEKALVARVGIQAALNAWWQGSTLDTPAVLVGEEGMGKTWAGVGWVTSNLAELPVVVIVPSGMVTQAAGSAIGLGVGDVGGRRRVWHNGRRDGAGRIREWRSASQARKADVVPVRALPYWPAAMVLLIEAGQMTASDYVPIHPDLPFASEGASTDAIRQFVRNDDRWSPAAGSDASIDDDWRPHQRKVERLSLAAVSGISCAGGRLNITPPWP